MTETFTAPTQEPLMPLLDRKYIELGKEYSQVVSSPKEKDQQPLRLSNPTEKALGQVANEVHPRLIGFAQMVAAYAPEDFSSYQELHPTSSIHLKALVGSIYNLHSKEEPDEIDQEMYIRTLSALSEGAYNIKNVGQGTDEVITSFLQDEFTKEGFANFLVQITKATLPIGESSAARAEARQAEFDTFYGRVTADAAKYRSVLRSHINRVFPGKTVPAAQDDFPIVFVNDINILAHVTNDFEINKRTKYHAGGSIGGVTWGTDEITGLTLLLHKLPSNFNKNSPEDENYVVAKDPSFQEVHTSIHEAIHTTAPIEANNDWHLMVNEVITDVATELVLLESHGQSFQYPDPKYLAEVGYRKFVNFTRNFAVAGVITEQELMEIGLKQDPEAFLRLVDERCALLSTEQCIPFIKLLVRNTMIKPIKKSEFTDKAVQFQKNPSNFLKEEMMAMWNTLGPNYFSHPFWLLEIEDKLRENPEYVEKMRKLYAAEEPELNFDKVKICRYPGEEVILTDEAVDIFRTKIDIPHSDGKGHSFCDDKLVEEHLQDHLQNIYLGTESLPEELRITGKNNAEMVKALVTRTNKAIGRYYAGKDVDKVPILMSVTNKMYSSVAEVLVRNWGDQGISVTPEDVSNIIGELAYYWLRTDLTYTHTIEPFIIRAKNMTEAITSPINSSDGMTVIPTKDQVLHYGRVLMEE